MARQLNALGRLFLTGTRNLCKAPAPRGFHRPAAPAGNQSCPVWVQSSPSDHLAAAASYNPADDQFLFRFRIGGAVNGILRVYEKSRRAGRTACLVAAISGNSLWIKPLVFRSKRCPPRTVHRQQTLLVTPVGKFNSLQDHHDRLGSGGMQIPLPNLASFD